MWSNAHASMMLLATLEMRGNLGYVKFAKTSGTVTGDRETQKSSQKPTQSSFLLLTL